MSDWKSILILPSTTILNAIRIIDDSSKQIGIVVDEERRLLGTVTDGDIRRGILKGISLEGPVRNVMNPHPVTARWNESREKILAVMRLKDLRHVPVLDEDGRVLSVEFFHEIAVPEGMEAENWVVLMAGGTGSRLRPLTDEFPKPLLRVGGKPILETILENFIEYGFRRFFLSVNYRAEMLEEHFGDGSRWGVDIRYLREKESMGTAAPLGLLPEPPTRPILVMNGDLLTRINFRQLLEYHNDHRPAATMCVREYQYQIPYGVVRMEKYLLQDIEEKPVHRCFVNAGIYVLEPGVLEYIPRNTRLDMPELFQRLLKEGREARAFPIREYWIDIGRMDDLEKAKGEYSEVFK